MLVQLKAMLDSSNTSQCLPVPFQLPRLRFKLLTLHPALLSLHSIFSVSRTGMGLVEA